jgi:hypothetical protein
VTKQSNASLVGRRESSVSAVMVRRCVCSRGTLLRDVHVKDMLLAALVVAVTLGGLALDYDAAASRAADTAAGYLAAVSIASNERLQMSFAPLAALLATTQISLAFIPWPWDLDTWTQARVAGVVC